MASEDRLSELTKSLRCHILSFLPTKDSVATSILSREWKELWTEVPTLDLQGRGRLSEEINRFLQWNVVPMDTFRICNWNPEVITQYALETWITTAIRRGVKTLCLALVLDCDISMPRSLFTSETLVNLSLTQVDIGTAWHRQVSLPCLKKLSLFSVYYRRDESLPQLLSGCPVLEDLVIEAIIEHEPVRSLIISSPTIQSLKVEVIDDFEDIETDKQDYRLEIDAPALEYLKITDWLLEYISAQMLSSLIEADVCIQTDRKKKDEAIYSGSVLDFVDKLCHVKHLQLAIGYDQFLNSTFSASTIKFGNLNELGLSADWRFITKFLENADKLQVLTIKPVENPLSCWIEPQQMPRCLSSHLRTITIHQFGRAEHQFEMIRYLLKNARILKTIKIHFYWGSRYKEKKSHAIQRISQFERGSEACEIVYN